MKIIAKLRNNVVSYTIKRNNSSFECTDISEIDKTTVTSLTYT